MSFWRATKLLLTLHCEESARLQSEELERKLTAVERWAVRLHFLGCRACRSFRRQLKFLQLAAKRQVERTQAAPLPESLRVEIANRIKRS